MAVRNRFSKTERHQPDISGQTLTQQQFKNDADINNIMARAKGTGIIGQTNQKTPRFGDFTASVDYQEMRNRIATANQKFEALPARLRRRFADDPYQLIRFLEDEENRDEAIKLGLLEKPAPEVKETPALKPDDEANPHQKKA